MTEAEIAAAIRAHYSEIGRRGGKQSAANMSPEGRLARAKKAGEAAGKVHREKAGIRRGSRAQKADT